MNTQKFNPWNQDAKLGSTKPSIPTDPMFKYERIPSRGKAKSSFV